MISREQLFEISKQAGFATAEFPGVIHARDQCGSFADGDLLKFATLVHAATVKETQELEWNRDREICDALIDGLTNDDQDAKQWFLESALKLIAHDEFEETKASWKWEDGIEPN